MLDTIFSSSTTATLSLSNAILTILTAFILGIIISFTYIKTNKRGSHSQSFVLSLIMIPSIIAIIILLVGSDIARAFSLAGAVSIIRFRSAPGDPKDITYIFFTLAVGLACGAGLILYAILFAAVLCLFMVVLSVINFGKPKTEEKCLKITIPDDLNYKGTFDDIFNMYTEGVELQKVRTADLGTLYELVYKIVMKNDINEKEFLDLIRCRNGNLNIVLTLAPNNIDY